MSVGNSEKLNVNKPVKNNLIANMSDGNHFIINPEPAIAIINTSIR